MSARKTSGCPDCKRLRDEMAALKAEVARLQEEVAKSRKDSSNSSKPPSSDIVNPPKRSDDKNGSSQKRKQGGQPGHPKHERPKFPPEVIDNTFDYYLDFCPECGHAMEFPDVSPDVQQQVEFIDRPIRIDEHRSQGCWCPSCQRMHYAPLPAEVKKAGLAGPRLTALVAYLKGACHASFSTIRKFLRDVAQISISRGQLKKLLDKVSGSLAGAYQELLEHLPQQPYLRVDETGHKDNGQRFWTWCFRAQLYTLFRIDKSRSSQVLIDVLGEEFQGVLGCDYFSAYRKYMREFGVEVQFCLAHLIRDVKYLLGLPDSKDQAYGRRLRDGLRDLFRVIHRRQEMTEEQFQQALETARDVVLKKAMRRVPSTKHAQNLAERFRKHGDAYFRFVTTPGIDPTNNVAEQAIRFVVIDRRVTQGTRSLSGRNWCQRIWTIIATCTQQDRSVFDFIHESVVAFFNETAGPSLLPDTS